MRINRLTQVQCHVRTDIPYTYTHTLKEAAQSDKSCPHVYLLCIPGCHNIRMYIHKTLTHMSTNTLHRHTQHTHTPHAHMSALGKEYYNPYPLSGLSTQSTDLPFEVLCNYSQCMEWPDVRDGVATLVGGAQGGVRGAGLPLFIW